MTALAWSVVIPAYNEARRLPPYLEEVIGFFEGRGDPYEVLVVDDGSTDGTANIVSAASRRVSAVRLLRSPHNDGKGASVRRGMLAARGERRLFADADGAAPIAEVKRLEVALAAGADVAIGSRARLDPAVSVSARAHRLLAGRVFNWVVARLGLSGIADSQCGFKIFTAAAADDLFSRLVTNGFGFDVEVLLRAQAAGYRVVEVPINWADQAGSKIGVLSNGPTMLTEVVRARLRMARERRGGCP
jgi:dolichyl-phosphate beta-glucosyltransferase